MPAVRKSKTTKERKDLLKKKLADRQQRIKELSGQETPEAANEIQALENQMALDTKELDALPDVEEDTEVKNEDDVSNTKLDDVRSPENRYTPAPNNDDANDILTLTEAVSMVSMSNADGPDDGARVVGWAGNTRFAGPHALWEYGPADSANAKYRFVRAEIDIIWSVPDLGCNTLGEQKNGRRFVRQKADLKAIQAVAWDYPHGHDCPLLLLHPNSWPKNKAGRPMAPYSRTKVKWTTGETSWETRTTLKRLIGNGSITIGKDFIVKGVTIIHAQERIALVNFVMITAAAAREQNYATWLLKNPQRTPTNHPGIEVHPEQEESSPPTQPEIKQES
jgi:hypothetical protein